MYRSSGNKTFIYGICLTAALGGFLFGYDTAVISGAIGSLEMFFIVPYRLPEAAGNALLGVMVSGALLGCIAGSALSGYCSQRFGRKRSLLLAAVLFIGSGIGSALPELGFALPGQGGHTVLPQFIFYRIAGGIGIGLASVLSPMYIAEVAPPSLRGRLVSWNQLAIVTGILTVYFVNYAISRQGDTTWNLLYGWRWMFASSAVPAVFFFAGLLFVPESPRWLSLAGRNGQAEHIRKKLRLEPLTALSSAPSDCPTVRKKRTPLKVWIAGILLSAFQQLVGIQVILYYAPEIFKNMGRETDSALLQTGLMGAANFLFTLLAVHTVDRYGRKPLLLAGSGSMAFFMSLLAVCFYTRQVGVIALTGLIGFVASFAFSWGPVVWVLLSEIFPDPVRSKMMAAAVAVQWITNYLVSSTFPLLDKSSWLVETFHHAFPFALFGTMAALSGLFAWKMIPETRGKRLEEIEQIWIKQPTNRK